MMKQHAHTDITTDQFSILQYILHHESVTATQIAQTFGVGKSAITAFVHRLEQKGFIERQQNRNDRRIIYLSLTEKGTHVVQETEKEIQHFLSDKLSHFDMDEIEQYLFSLEKLALLMDDSK